MLHWSVARKQTLMLLHVGWENEGKCSFKVSLRSPRFSITIHTLMEPLMEHYLMMIVWVLRHTSRVWFAEHLVVLFYYDEEKHIRNTRVNGDEIWSMMSGSIELCCCHGNSLMLSSSRSFLKCWNGIKSCSEEILNLLKVILVADRALNF